MLAIQRQAAILELVLRHGGVRHGDLIAMFGASSPTIRRDLAVLEERGLIARVHGGAVRPRPAPPASAQATPEAREDPPEAPGTPDGERRHVFAAIAETAARHVRPSTTVGLTAGSGMDLVARALAGIADLTVVTTLVSVAQALAGIPYREHIVVGGQQTPAGAVGPLAIGTIAALHIDTLIVRAHGMHPVAGFTASRLDEAETIRALIGVAQRVIVLADHRTWNTVGIATIAPLDRPDVLISDDGLPDDARAALAARVACLALAATAPVAPAGRAPGLPRARRDR